MKTPAILASLSLFASGCMAGYGVPEQALSGQIGGEDWVFVEGYAEPIAAGDPDLHIVLYPQAVEDGCSASLAAGNKILFRAPQETGIYDLSLTRSVTLVVDGENSVDNYVATFGVMDVRSVSATAMDGGLDASFNERPDFRVRGTFAVEICPGPQ